MFFYFFFLGETFTMMFHHTLCLSFDINEQEFENLATCEADGSEGKVSVHVLPKSGHWVHVDNPKGLLEIVAPKLSSLRP